MVSLSNKMSLKYPLTNFVSRHVSGAWIEINAQKSASVALSFQGAFLRNFVRPG